MSRIDATPTRWAAWGMATRPRTLPAAVGPVMIGTAAAVADESFAALPALAALTGALLLQIAVNLANDYFDYCRGIDTAQRVGPVRVTQSGLIPPGQVLGAMWLVLALAGACGTYLVTVGGWPVVFIGLASIAGVIGYSGGPYPLASHGLGDLFVFFFFGPVAVGGTYYVQALVLTNRVVVWSIPPGLLIAAILVVNNLRDIDTDRAAGKRTLAVVVGPRWSRIEYGLLVAMAYSIPVVMWMISASSPVVMLSMLTLPMGVLSIRGIFHESGAALNTRLGATALLSFWFCLLLSIGIAIS